MDKCAGKKIIVLGCSGSGKSLLSKRLAAATGLPLFHLDNIWWKPDRTHISRDEFDLRLSEILSGGSWIIDGDYSRTYETRFRACDTVIFLDLPETLCLESAALRTGTARDDIPWTEDAFDPRLKEEILRYRGENRPAVYSLTEKHPEKNVFIFTDRGQADRWVSSLQGNISEIDDFELTVPAYGDLWFRRQMMEDPDTMSYNHSWGGTIPFPEEDWKDWYDHWVVYHEEKRFYRHVTVGGRFVGETAYHWDSGYGACMADVIIYAPFRGKGYGGRALDMLCQAVKDNGFTFVRDDMALDNPAVSLFLRHGFREEYRDGSIMMLKKDL